jgi:hypothetical protein
MGTLEAIQIIEFGYQTKKYMPFQSHILKKLKVVLKYKSPLFPKHFTPYK